MGPGCARSSVNQQAAKGYALSQNVPLLRAAGKGQTHAVTSEILDADTFADFKDRAERAYIAQHLRENDWNVAETARRIDMPRSNLYKKIDRLKLQRDT